MKKMKKSLVVSATLIVFGCLVLALSLLMDVVSAAEWLIRSVGADSLLLGRGLYKLQILRPLSVLFGMVVNLLGFLSILYPFQFDPVKRIWAQSRSVKGRMMLCLYAVFLTIGVGTLSYYGMYTAQGVRQYAGLTEDERIRLEFQHSGYGNALDVLETIRQEVPADSNMALICRNHIAHILHYYLYPRRIFSDAGVKDPSEFEREWIDKNEISRIVWLRGFPANSGRIGSDSMRVQIIVPNERGGQSG